MDQAQRQQEFLRQQQLWQQVVSGMYGGGGMSPIGSTTTQSGGGPNAMGMLGGAGSGAAMGAMMGSVVPGLGTGLGALLGGGMGLFGGMCWIADALFGEGSEKAKAARAWVTEGWQGDEADEFREWYEMNGPAIAQEIKNGQASEMKVTAYFGLFDEFVAKGREYLAVQRVA
jgi:hypothetical protein